MFGVLVGMAPLAMAAIDPAASVTTSTEINWSVVTPLIIFALGNLCALAYMFGRTSQEIRAFDRDLERVRVDVERVHEQNRDADLRIHNMALVLSKIDTRLDLFLAAASDTATCPLFKSNLARRKGEVVDVAPDEKP